LITGWLLKIVIVIAVIGAVFVEVGSPVITHFQVDGAAHDAADDAASSWFQKKDQTLAQDIASQDAAKEHATVESFVIDDNNVIHVRLFKQARSFVLKKFSWAKKWYEVRVSASSAGPTGR
jgi:hypothetical protein